jgi:signal transduction histidine kinase/HAMP domain-containing protein
MRGPGRLVRKYLVIMVGLVTGALVASGAIEIYASYNENKAALGALQREKAGGAASRIESFVRGIERQLGWTTQPLLVPPAAAIEQRRLDAVRLQRQELAITEVSHLDAAGREQLRVSRLAMDVIGGHADLSGDPKFTVAKSGRTYFGPVYFRKESEPYMTIAMPQSGGGVTVAEVNLKFIWDVVSQIKVGKAGLAYVVDGRGALIAHPDISLVLQKTNLAGLAQVKAALTPSPGDDVATIGKDPRGRDVLAAHSAIAPLGWVVLVEQPLEEAFAPLRASVYRTMVLVALGIGLAVVASAVLARRLAKPIQALQVSAAKIGAGELDHQITVRTGDELESLADEFNRMTGQLRESYANLEQKVEDRTRALTESLEQQTATSEILKVISSSPTDVQPVFDTIVRRAVALCGGLFGVAYRYEGGHVDVIAHHGVPEDGVAQWRGYFPRPLRPPEQPDMLRPTLLDGETVHIRNAADDPRVSPDSLSLRRDVRSVGIVPIRRAGRVVGALAVSHLQVAAFTDSRIALLQTFADQAVIAIENVRLFKELEARNAALTESLEQQTATAEILRVISASPTDVQPVLEAVAESAARLCGAADALIHRVEGDVMRRVAHVGSVPIVPMVVRPVTPGTPAGLAIVERRTIHVHDIVDNLARGDFAEARALQEGTGFRTILVTPLMRDDVAIGVIVIRRLEVHPFTDAQIALLQTFAAQAVIAIENVRLFKELEARNAALTESLDQQTATADILRVISSSPTDLQPVMEALVESAAVLCEAQNAQIFRVEDRAMRLVARYGPVRSSLEAGQTRPITRGSVSGRTITDCIMIHVPDLLAEVDGEYPDIAAAIRREGIRTTVGVPLMREGVPIGSITAFRTETRPFTDKQIALLQTFADQAVIAIENVRLFQELQARTADLTRSVGELQALGEVGRTLSATLDLPTVLTTIVTHAVALAGTSAGMMFEFEEGESAFRLRAAHNMDQRLVDLQHAEPIRLGEGAVGQAVQTRSPVQVEDLRQVPPYASRQQVRQTLIELGYRSVLAVPLLVEERILGALVVFRQEAGGFAPATVDLLRTFGTQSALAIQNARLFREIETKSRELQIANQHKDEFLASMSHELRTPLNAIIGFSEVMLERLFGDVNAKQEEYLNDILSSGRHLLSLINDILDLAKIEAGRMELEPADFDLPQAIDNALVLVRERALRRGITLDQSIDPRLGEIKGDERKIKQVLLNLLSNAVKFTPEGGRIDVRAALADGAAEVSVTDTGVGIAPEDHAAVFEEFRQVGTDYARKHEGTGLGLALARKFVELHGGTIRVESQLGRGATFTFTIPVTPWQAS